METFSDEELMERYIGGDNSALKAIFDRYVTLLTRMMARGMLTQAATSDLVQQTFLQLHRARNDFKQGSKLRPWLFTIAMNIKRQHLRKLGRRREDALEFDGRTEPRVAAHDIERTERRRNLRLALAQLPEGQREVIELHWLEGLSFAEVAEIVGAKLSAVKVRAHRGYARLREILEAIESNPNPDSRIQQGER
jgi:RNA polymerase sigma factor (sigma-70 family)